MFIGLHVTATVAAVAMMFGLFTETELTGQTAILYAVFFILVILGIWM